MLVLLFAALALGPLQEAVAQTASSDYAQAEEVSGETAAPELSYETQFLMEELEERSYEKTLKLRLGRDQSLSALRAGTYPARDVFFGADSVYWLASGREDARRQAPLWQLERVTIVNRKKGFVVGGAFGSLIGLAAGAVAIQVTGQTSEQGASIGPSLAAIPAGALLGALVGYVRGSRRRYTFDDLPTPPAPLPDATPAPHPASHYAALESEVERLRAARSMMIDRVSALEEYFWELEDQVDAETNLEAARTDVVTDSLRRRLNQVENRLGATTDLLATLETMSIQPETASFSYLEAAREGAQPAPAHLTGLLERADSDEPAYGVVVASLSRREDAMDVSERLEELLRHYSDRYIAAVVPSEDQSSHRAVFGPFESADAAKEALGALADVLPNPKRGQTGLLKVLVKPWGSIYIDGELRQRETDLPYAAPLTPDTYRVTAVHPTLGTWERTVYVAPGEEASVVVDLNAPDASSVVASVPLPQDYRRSVALIPRDAWVVRLR
ncbi:MAG: SPOR domain-containing protein [Rhodothermales bacterium]